jgi:hypothetical protein
MVTTKVRLLAAAAACAAAAVLELSAAQAPARRGGGVDEGPVRDGSGAVIGFTKTAPIPGTPWRIHDAARPHPKVVTPGAAASAAPSDAILLFVGQDLSPWRQERSDAAP